MEPPVMSMMAEVIGHRGAPTEFRENTVRSFARALEHGAHAIELDVHATSDDVVVVHHDAWIGRENRRSIARLTMDELTQLSAGESDPIPTLGDVLALLEPDHTAYVEIKAPGIESLVVEALRGARAGVAVHSFDHRIVRTMHALQPALRYGVLMSSYLLDPGAPVRDTGARDLWQQWELIDQALVDRAHELGASVIAWTVNDPSVAHRLLRLGVRGICTDRPDVMVRELRAS